MDGVLGRLYVRMGKHYWLLFVLAAAFLVVTIVPAFMYVSVVRYLGAQWSAGVRALGLSVFAVGVATALDVWLILRRSLPALAWIRGERRAENAAAAWEAGAHMQQLHVSIAPWPVSAGAVVAIYAIYDATHPPLITLGVLAIGGVVVVALGLALHMVTTGAIMRPVLADIDARFPQNIEHTRVKRASLRPRIVVSSLLVVVSSAWLTAGIVARTSDPVLVLALPIGTGIVVGAVFALVLTIALAQSVFDPLRDMTKATRDVQDGNFTTRVPVISDDELGDLARSFNDMVRGLAERESLRSALGAYIDPTITERLINEGQVLRSDEVDVTVMFIDIVGFTSRAEMLHASQTVALLNEFFGLVIPVVQDHGGHANKLLGDGLMAVFGAPVALPDHADKALAAAFGIQRSLAERYGTTLRAGIGLNTGSVIVGTTGGGTKLDYTVIGDTVNVAQRVEALTRETGDDILLTEATRLAMLGDGALVSRGVTPVKGRTEPVSVFAARSNVPA